MQEVGGGRAGRNGGVFGEREGSMVGSLSLGGGWDRHLRPYPNFHPGPVGLTLAAWIWISDFGTAAPSTP